MMQASAIPYLDRMIARLHWLEAASVVAAGATLACAECRVLRHSQQHPRPDYDGCPTTRYCPVCHQKQVPLSAALYSVRLLVRWAAMAAAMPPEEHRAMTMQNGPKVRFRAAADGGVVYAGNRRIGTLSRREDGQYLAAWDGGSLVCRDQVAAIEAITAAWQQALAAVPPPKEKSSHAKPKHR